MSKRFFLFILILLAFSVIPAKDAHSHLDAGYHSPKNGYIIEVGYSPDELSAGENIILNFNLLNESTEESMHFDNLFLRISDSKRNVFAGYLNPSNDNVNFVFTFPSEGTYEINARFYDGSRVLVEDAQNVKVHAMAMGGPHEAISNLLVPYSVILTIALITILFSWNGKAKRRKGVN
jgi:hypothetical protein